METKAQALLKVLREFNGQWVKRTEIAQRLGRNRLNAGEIAVLDVLAEQGTIGRMYSTETNAPSGKVALYRSGGGNGTEN